MKIKDQSLYMRLRSIKQMDKFESFAKEIIAEPTEIHPVISQLMADIMTKSSYISPNLAIEFIIKVGDKAFYTNKSSVSCVLWSFSRFIGAYYSIWVSELLECSTGTSTSYLAKFKSNCKCPGAIVFTYNVSALYHSGGILYRNAEHLTFCSKNLFEMSES